MAKEDALREKLDEVTHDANNKCLEEETKTQGEVDAPQA